MKRQKKINITKSAKGRFTLIVGDEGAILVKISEGKVVNRIFASAPDEVSTRTMADNFLQSPGYPITVLFDFIDQSYVRQTLPPVSSFSVGKIITRRLNKDFLPDDIKGYVILDREKTGRKDWNYLMVSLPNNGLLQKWINFVVEKENPFGGIGLVPIEVQPMMRAIEKKFLKEKGKNAKPLEWNILVTHNKVGGFRQVVLRNGKLILTRMAQPVGESSPDVIAGNIEQEIINTLEYLKRLGLQDSNTATITVICSEEIKKFLDTNNIKVGENHLLTPYETGNLLGLKDSAQPNDHFGDIIISSFVAKRKKLLLQLNTPYTQKIIKCYNYLKYLKIFFITAILAFIAVSAFNGYEIYVKEQEISKLEETEKGLSSDLAKLKTKSSSIETDANYYNDIVTLVKLMNQPDYNLLEFVNTLSLLGEDSALVQKMEWTLSDLSKSQPTSENRSIKSVIDFHLTASKLSKVDFSANVMGLIGNLKKSFGHFDVTYTDIPGITSEEKEIKSIITQDGNVQDANPQTTQVKDILNVTITGPNSNKVSPTK